MKKSALTLLYILLTFSISAQSDNNKKNDDFFNNNLISAGFELNAIPYFSGGYYAAFWLSYNEFRLRFIRARTSPPGFVINDGFKDLRIDTYALYFDFFPSGYKWRLEGLRAGAGFEYWDNEAVNSADNAKGKFKTYMFSLDVGYMWFVWKEIYLNPLFATHLRIGGDRETVIGNASYSSQYFVPEISVNIGWHF